MDLADIELVALTGGPCGGKSSLMNALRERGSLGGRELFFVPEAATILINQGHDVTDVVNFQTEVLGLQLELEGEAIRQAQERDVPSVIICDRGTIDGSAYCTDEQWSQIVDAYGCTRDELSSRYGLVVHLASVAADVPEAYTTGNNEARFEDLEGAVAQEQRTLAAWSAHPNRIVLRGYPTLAGKLEAAIAAIELSIA